jgi:methylisocitrate lyase
MANPLTPGARFRAAVTEEKPLQILGSVNPYCALMAEKTGAKALYLSGSGVATASHGLPDLGITSLEDVVEDARRITSASNLPLLVDIDTGWGSAFNIARSVREMIRAGVAAVHIEDQVTAKRCGHRPGKAVVSKEEMVDRIKAAVDARTDPGFVIMARTDAVAVEGLDVALQRASACVEAGADMVFPEAMPRLEDYRRFVETVRVPVLANLTEFGKTPIFTREELAGAGVAMILYPLSAHRAMAKAALLVYQAILRDGHQRNVLDLMQTRDELYEFLNYHRYEQELDRLFGKD